jgi:hypothetical protein
MIEDKIIAADRAAEVLANPFFKAALNDIEQRAVEDARNVKGWMPGADRRRRQLLERANIIREIRAELTSIVTTGALSAKPQPGVA